MKCQEAERGRISRELHDEIGQHVTALLFGLTSPSRGNARPYAAAHDAREAVLTAIAEGYSNKEIAGTLEISVKTVESDKTRAMEKLGLRGRVDIVRVARERGWRSAK